MWLTFSQWDVNEMSTEIKDKVNPAMIGVGIKIGINTRKEGVVLQLENNKDMNTVKDKIQENFGDEYKVEKKKRFLQKSLQNIWNR